MLENIRQDIIKLNPPPSFIKNYLQKLAGISCRKELEEVDNITLWKVHELITDRTTNKNTANR